MRQLNDDTSAEMRRLNGETNAQMRMLYEDLKDTIKRITLLWRGSLLPDHPITRFISDAGGLLPWKARMIAATFL